MRILFFMILAFMASQGFAQNRLPDCNGNFEGPCFYSGVAKKDGVDIGNRYEGEVRNGDFNGNGTLHYANGDRYVGQWKDGLRDGLGNLYKNDGSTQKGIWKEDVLVKEQNSTPPIVNNPNNSKNRLPDCNGVFTGPCYYAGAVSKGGQTSLNRYEGEILNSRWHGAGIYYYLDPGDLRGDRYEGNFINGSKEGKGTYYWSSRDVYVGDFKNNKIEGFGTKTYSTGSKYVGEFKNGQFDGQGTFTYLTEGDEYVGQFKEDYRHGSGIYSYANGERYVGMYQKGKKNGQGILYGKNGSILKQGVWKDGKFVEAPVPPPLVTIPPPIKPKPTITPPPPVKPKPSITPPPAPVETSFDGKRQKCLRLGLKPGTEDYRSCMD
jgi:hypothetical protein